MEDMTIPTELKASTDLTFKVSYLVFLIATRTDQGAPLESKWVNQAHCTLDVNWKYMERRENS